jgi:LacI family transcriptional regulator
MERNTYQKIAAELRDRISNGALESGSFLPTERELQEEFSASRSTVRRALAFLVESGFAQSVPNRGVLASRGSSSRRTGNVALIDGPSFVLRVMGYRLTEQLRDQGLYLVHLGGSLEYPTEYGLQTALDNEFVGAMVWPYRAFIDVDFVEQAARRLPIVSLDHRLEGALTDLVTFDYETAACEAVTQLIRQGCKRIAVSGMLDMLDITHQRFRGYMRAMFAHGLQPQPRDFVFTKTSGTPDPDPYPLEMRLRAADRPDGLFVLQDMFVPSSVEAALRCGLSIPHDLKIVTIGDDIDLTVDGVGLTAVAMDWDAFAEQAMKLLRERIANPHKPIETVAVGHHLIIRGLCGAPDDQWTEEPDRLRGFAGDLPIPRSRYQYSSSWSVQGNDGIPNPQ